MTDKRNRISLGSNKNGLKLTVVMDAQFCLDILKVTELYTFK